MVKNRPILSAEARQYKRDVALKFYGNDPLTGPVQIDLILHPKNRRCMDLDNALKVAIDSLQGICYENDSQITRLTIERGDIVPGGCLSVKITAL